METIKPRFSVVIPAYNVEPFIFECVNSVLQQSFQDFEVIIVIDASPDKTISICNELALNDKRITIIQNQINKGLVKTRQIGANKAVGDYILCLDGDDWLDTNCLESLSSIIDQNDADVICFGAHFRFSNRVVDHPFLFCSGFLQKKDIIDCVFPRLIQGPLADYFPPSLWGKAFKRNLYLEEQNNVDSRIKIGEDGACVIPIIYKANSVFCLEKCLYNYRQFNGSMTKSRKVFDIDCPKRIVEHLSSRIDINEYEFRKQLDRKMVHDLFIASATQFYQKKKYKNVCKELRTIFSDPFYSSAIKNASFSNSFRAKLMHFSIKHHLFLLIKIYSMLK